MQRQTKAASATLTDCTPGGRTMITNAIYIYLCNVTATHRAYNRFHPPCLPWRPIKLVIIAVSVFLPLRSSPPGLPLHLSKGLGLQLPPCHLWRGSVVGLSWSWQHQQQRMAMLEVLENRQALVELLEGRLRGLERPELRSSLREVWGKVMRAMLSKWRQSWILLVPRRKEAAASKSTWETIFKANAAGRLLKKLVKSRKDSEKDVDFNPPVKFMILNESMLPTQQSTYFSYEILEETSNVYMDMAPEIYMQPIIYMEPITVTYSRVLSYRRAWPLPQDCETPPRPPRQPPPVPAPPSRPSTPATSTRWRQESSPNDLFHSLSFCSACSKSPFCLCVTSL